MFFYMVLDLELNVQERGRFSERLEWHLLYVYLSLSICLNVSML